MIDNLIPQLVQVTQLLVVWLNEKYRQQTKAENLNLEDFKAWLSQKNHQEVLSFLEENKENTKQINEVLDKISNKIDITQQTLTRLFEEKFKVTFPVSQQIWRRPYLARFGEKWHYIVQEENGEVEYFNAKWKLRVPYQAQLMSKQFQVSIREAIDRMDAEGPFCSTCGVELVQDIKQGHILWQCDGCRKAVDSDLLIDEARAKVVRINKPRILKLWLEKYGDK